MERALLKLAGTRESEGALSREARIERIKEIERGVVWRGALAGAVSGLAAAGGVQLADPLFIETPAHWSDMLPYYGVTLGISGGATIIEIAFLFWDGARGALHIGVVADSLDAEGETELGTMEMTLLRAGLETPPPRTLWRGIDPLATKSRARLLLFSLLYKAKVGGTSAIVKALVRKIAARLGGRTVARSVVELAAAPVFAIWNAVVCKKVMREARIRALGPSAVEQIYEQCFPRGFGSCSTDEQKACFLVLREEIVAAGRRHPNVTRMGYRMFVNTSYEFDPEDPETFDQVLERLSEAESERVVNFALMLAVLDGNLTRNEKNLATEMARRAGIEDADARLQAHLEAVENGGLLTVRPA
jgi:tellurite resistance protein